MRCEICGKETELVTAEIEGTVMNTCEPCARFGKVLSRKILSKQVEIKIPSKRVIPEIETTTELIVEDYAKKIRAAREKIGVKQEVLAKRINEKESVIHNLESGKLMPPIELAKKIGDFLKIKLVEEYTEKKETKSRSSKQGLTIGDLIKFK